MIENPENFCQYRREQKDAAPICTVLFVRGAHNLQCKAPELVAEECPVPYLATNQISLDEASDWLTQIQTEPPSSSS